MAGASLQTHIGTRICLVPKPAHNSERREVAIMMVALRFVVIRVQVVHALEPSPR